MSVPSLFDFSTFDEVGMTNCVFGLGALVCFALALAHSLRFRKLPHFTGNPR